MPAEWRLKPPFIFTSGPVHVAFSVATLESGPGLFIQRVGIDLRLGDCRYGTVAHGVEKAIAAPGVTGDAFLVDLKQQGVGVTIPAHLLQRLHLTRAFALAPQLAARA